MAFKKLVSGFVKQKISSNLINGLNNAVGGFGQPKKLAAKLANKSPLDLSKSPSAHMEPVNNPFSYGNVYYPEETSNLGEGHYIIFDVIEHRDSTQKLPNGVIYPGSLGRVGERKFNTGKRLQKLISQGFQTEKKLLRENSSGTQATTKTFHENISDSIILYTPSTNTKFNYSVGYENIDTGLAKQIRGLFDGGDILKKLGDTGGTFTRTIIEAGMNIALPGFGGLVQKETGTALNPNTEMVFTGVPFRSFSYPFEFAPKSKQEQDSVQKIINLFKFHMMPEREGYNNLRVPSEFQITYMYREGPNSYIPQISRCALTDMNIDYSPEGVFTTFKGDDRGAAPVLTKVDLTFTEMEIMTKETISEGM